MNISIERKISDKEIDVNSVDDWSLNSVFNNGSEEKTNADLPVEYLDDLEENDRVRGLKEIWRESFASSPSRYDAAITFWELAKTLYKSEDLCRADILTHFEEIELPQWFKRVLGVKRTLQDVFSKKLGWG